MINRANDVWIDWLTFRIRDWAKSHETSSSLGGLWWLAVAVVRRRWWLRQHSTECLNSKICGAFESQMKVWNKSNGHSKIDWYFCWIMWRISIGNIWAAKRCVCTATVYRIYKDLGELINFDLAGSGGNFFVALNKGGWLTSRTAESSAWEKVGISIVGFFLNLIHSGSVVLDYLLPTSLLRSGWPIKSMEIYFQINI